MTVKRGIVIAAILSSVLIFSGCVDAMPDMTDEENDLVAEYAATILLKHSNSYKYRLVSDEQLERALFEENQALQAAIEEAIKEQEQAEEESEEESNGEISEDADSSKNNPEDENGEGETITVETDEFLYLSEENLAEYLGIEDSFSIKYIGRELANTFPEEESDSGFQLSASKDNTFLVLHFELENITDGKVYCDMMEVNPSIKLNVNNNGYVSIENTLLMNDFTTFMNDVKPGESCELVALLEIPDEEVETLSLQIKTGKEKTEIIVD